MTTSKKKAAPRLTAQQKRDRDMAAMIAEVQRDYEKQIEELKFIHQHELAKTATDNYVLGWDQSRNDANASLKAQSFIDRLLKKEI